MSEKPSQYEEEINSVNERGVVVNPKVNKPYEPLHKEFNNIMEPKLLDSFHCTCITKWIGITLGKSVKNIKVSIPEYQSKSH
jgi:hypothetical protein